MARWTRVLFATLSSAVTCLAAAVALDDRTGDAESDHASLNESRQQLLDRINEPQTMPFAVTRFPSDRTLHQTLLTTTRFAVSMPSSQTTHSPQIAVRQANTTQPTTSSITAPPTPPSVFTQADSEMNKNGIPDGQIAAIVIGVVFFVAACIVLYLKWGAIIRVLNSGYYQSGHHKIENQRRDCSNRERTTPNMKAGQQIREHPDLSPIVPRSA